MRSADEVDCHRGYEWALMKEAVKRNPSITLYGLPWSWAGWLGFGANTPYTNVSATAEYTTNWLECGRDAHGLNVSMIGIWNEEEFSVDYILALRKRLDAGGFAHVRIIAPDGGGHGMDQVAKEMATNASVKAAVAALGSHYPGAAGTSPQVRGAGVPLWAAEDYSTYSDATGAGCWGRLLVQNLGWDFTATISWYLIGSFARGMDYDSDGILRAEWPASGHFELTPMLWTTMHWTRFVKPGWRALPCTDASVPTGRCALAAGGNYAALASDSDDFAIIVHAFRHNTSKCIRCDPKTDWVVADSQTVSFQLQMASPPKLVHAWRSCTSWVYGNDTSANESSWFVQQPDVTVSATGALEVEILADCYYTFTSVGGVSKPVPPAAVPKSEAFPLPFSDDFDGRTVGAEAPYFGDQMGKWETVAAGGGRPGNASRQQLGEQPWPICWRGHSQPISIIGDMFFENLEVSADILLESAGVGGGLGLRVRNPDSTFYGAQPGIFLYVVATPGVPPVAKPSTCSSAFQLPGACGGVPPPRNVLMNDTTWKLCSDSYCQGEPIASGVLPAAWGVNAWHRLSLSVVNTTVTASMDEQLIHSGDLVSTGVKPGRNSKDGGLFGGRVPKSGWAALVSTLGHVQYDDFRLVGKAPGGGAVAPCAGRALKAGDAIVSAPCDAPGAMNVWGRLESGELTPPGGAGLCLGSKGGAAALVACGSDSLRFDHRTGRILDSEEGCLDVVTQYAGGGPPWAPVATGTACAAIASAAASSQQYQWNPATGNLRPKGAMCVADFPGAINQYRDCCLSVCSAWPSKHAQVTLKSDDRIVLDPARANATWRIFDGIGGSASSKPVDTAAAATSTATRTCSFPATKGLPFCNNTAPTSVRVADLVARLTSAEKLSMMLSLQEAAPRLKVNAYDWGNECLHGVALESGVGGLAGATIFPQPIGLGASFNPALLHAIGDAISTESRALSNAGVEKTPGVPAFQDCWAPNMNIYRDPR